MPLSNETWKAVVRRKFKMSTQFRNLDAAVVQYLNLTPAPQKEDARQTLKVRWDAWEKKLEQNGKTYKSSDRYFQNCALDDVASLVAGAGVKAELNVKLSPSRQNAVTTSRRSPASAEAAAKSKFSTSCSMTFTPARSSSMNSTLSPAANC